MRILYPYKNALWALRPAKPLGVLSRHPCRNPKPLPRGEGLCMLGWLCIVQSLLAYTPGIRAEAILLGLPPQTKQGCLQSATQSHCTMQWHKWLTTCTGATPLRPHFQKIQRFIDRLKAAAKHTFRHSFKFKSDLNISVHSVQPSLRAPQQYYKV